MTSGAYSKEANRQRFIELGCDAETAALLVEAGVQPQTVGSSATGCGPFVMAALHHDLSFIDERLQEAGGDPDVAWQAWADEENGVDDDDALTGPFVYGQWRGEWVILTRAVAEQRAATPDGVDPRTIALDQVGRLEESLGDEYGEERQGLGGEPVLHLDESARDQLLEALSDAGLTATRDDALFATMR